MSAKLHIAMFGSSLVSAYWNGAATYYRGIIRALAARGHRVTFYEPDAYDRQSHRDIPDPSWARVVVYQPTPDAALGCLEEARDCDVVIKASGVGVLDELLEHEVPLLRGAGGPLVAFWDVDAPATLERLQQCTSDPFHHDLRQYDLVLTYGGGPEVVRDYQQLGAAECVPIYNAVDPDTHFPVAPDPNYSASLSFLGNRMPDREVRVEVFFFDAAARLPDHQFLLGGSGWEGAGYPANVRYVGHVYSRDHNAFNCSPLAVLNINRQSMARYGYSPATRVFEAAGAGACLISDRWEGIETFLEPGSEVLLADNGAEVAEHVAQLDKSQASKIGQAARRRVLADHTYVHRARQLEEVLLGRYSPAAAAP